MYQQLIGFAAEYLASADAGGETWWRQVAQQGTPFIDPLPEPDQYQVTFFWRDPQGGSATSPIKQVLIDINGITDHHSFTPASLVRLNNSDVWFGHFRFEADWRGSYSFIPITAQHLPPEPTGSAQQQRQQQRDWWCSLFPFTQADPLNRHRPHSNSHSMSLSAIHMPLALSQASWQTLDNGEALFSGQGLTQIDWHSALLARQRPVWLWQPSQQQARELPLVIVLDGRTWAERMPLFALLETETAAGRLPPAAWLLIDAINGEVRSQELPCNPEFWQAVQQELLPQISQYGAITEDPAQTVVAGQSYGGLAALYAGLFWPERFGCVLTQSGSFWWPNVQFMTHFEQRHSHELGWLTQQVLQRPVGQPLRIFQEAGRHEADIHFVNQQMHQQLCQAGHQVNYRIYNGGHDGLCWRGGLIDGVRWLLTPSQNDHV